MTGLYRQTFWPNLAKLFYGNVKRSQEITYKGFTNKLTVDLRIHVDKKLYGNGNDDPYGIVGDIIKYTKDMNNSDKTINDAQKDFISSLIQLPESLDTDPKKNEYYRQIYENKTQPISYHEINEKLIGMAREMVLEDSDDIARMDIGSLCFGDYGNVIVPAYRNLF